MNSRKESWLKLTEKLLGEVRPLEQLSLGLVGEDSLFLRLNGGKLRQGTHVEQFLVEMIFQSEGRKVQFDFSSTGNFETDAPLALGLLERAREEVRSLPLDPYAQPLENNGQSDQDFVGELPSEKQAIEQIIHAHGTTDFSGFYCGGQVVRASRNSAGQNHWFSTLSFFYDYSLFIKAENGADKAVKGTYSEKNWNPKKLAESLDSSTRLLNLLRKPARRLAPGSYRAYLAPGAVSEITDILSWGAVSGSSFQRGRSPFAKLALNQVSLSSLFTLRENFDLGLCPRFNSIGEVAPIQVDIIEKGKLKNWLVSSRTAKEFNMTANGAEGAPESIEGLRSPEILPGNMPQSEALQRLGTGIWLGNLHYLNWSDVPSARITGMTRYACFWVENGEIIAPIDDMRFDESLYRIFGSELEALTAEQSLEPNVMTYERRSIGGKKIPGALIKDFRFTF